jgi:hypothetical protein
MPDTAVYTTVPDKPAPERSQANLWHLCSDLCPECARPLAVGDYSHQRCEGQSYESV